MKRILDLFLTILFFVLFSVPTLLIALLIKMTSKGSVLYWSDRIGRNNVIFKMPKFRTMKVNAPLVPTHLLTDPDQYCTPFGKFLRKFSLDELPQLFSVLKGDMSFVGPRPALYNQDDLIELRTQKGIHILTPGITGWAQVNGRDDLPIPLKVELDEFYLQHHSFVFDIKTLLMTFFNVIGSKGIKH